MLAASVHLQQSCKSDCSGDLTLRELSKVGTDSAAGVSDTSVHNHEDETRPPSTITREIRASRM